MGKYILHILSLFFSIPCFGQDQIVKKDSTKIEAKILEVRSEEIKYNYFNYQEGPTLILHKNEVAYVIYSNGVRESFHVSKPEMADQPPAFIYPDPSLIKEPKKDALKKEMKAGDYIKLNIQAGMVLNNSFSNLSRRDPQPSHTSSEEYSGKNDGKYNCNINLGVNFLFGNSPYVQHVVGINYLRSKGEFDHDFYQGGYTSYHSHSHYTSKVDFINIVTGLRFPVGRHIKLEPLIALNIVARTDIRKTGAATTTSISGGPTPMVTNTETEYFNNAPVAGYDKNIGTTVSFCPRLCYEFKIKQQAFGAYVSYNAAYLYRLPWYMVGISYYPFKKLSVPLDGKKLKLFNNAEFSVDVGIVINKSYSNKARRDYNLYKSPEKSYDYFYSKNALHQETGLNLGFNLAHGNSSICKHIIGLSYIQSKSNFIRVLGQRYSESGKLYEDVTTVYYNTTVHFLNISTGIRLTAFKHLNFDNSIAYTIPLLASNKINGTQYVRESSPTGTGSYYETGYSEQQINTTSSELFVKPALSFIPRVSFDFKIGQQRFGCYYSYNLSMEYKLPWNMMGVTYYPFKKLR